jgi:hypothetical protein
MSTDVIESARLTTQVKLDSAKTPAERNKLGQFSTPTDLSTDILTYARTMMPHGTPVRFLDPAIGTGSFYSALLRTFPADAIKDARGFEIDTEIVREAKQIWQHSTLRINLGDFTQAMPPLKDSKKATLLICNPPYVRHHHLSQSEKIRLRETIKLLAKVSLSGLSGLYGYFLCLSAAWMAKNGLAGWLIPSEFMDVNYGRQIKSFLLDHVTLLRIHRFKPEDVQFKNALVSSAVVWFKNTPTPTDHSVEFTYGGTLIKPDITKQVSVDDLRACPKWTRFPQQNGKRPEQNGYRLADLFTIKRGLATGANEYFILTPEQAVKREIPNEFLTPILPSSRYLLNDEIASNEKGEPILDRKLYLLTCNLPESEVKAKYPTLWRYLESGMSEGISERYLCKNRAPWYAQENRPPAPILCTYMGRQNNSRGKPFRFILNHSKATAANVFLMLYPTSILQTKLTSKPDLFRSIWKQLSEISIYTLTSEGRVYGGGLHKLEPKELGNVILRQTF